MSVCERDGAATGLYKSRAMQRCCDEPWFEQEQQLASKSHSYPALAIPARQRCALMSS